MVKREAGRKSVECREETPRLKRACREGGKVRRARGGKEDPDASQPDHSMVASPIETCTQTDKGDGVEIRTPRAMIRRGFPRGSLGKLSFAKRGYKISVIKGRLITRSESARAETSTSHRVFRTSAVDQSCGISL